MQITLTDHAVIFNQRAYVVYLQNKRRKGADRYVHRRFELKALKRTLNQKLCKLMKVFTTPPLHPEAPYLMDPADQDYVYKNKTGKPMRKKKGPPKPCTECGCVGAHPADSTCSLKRMCLHVCISDMYV